MIDKSGIRARWEQFKDLHPSYSVIILGLFYVGMGGAAALLAGPASQIALCGLIIGAAGFLPVAAGIRLCREEHKANNAIETATDVAGQTLEGPHWAVTRVLKAEAAGKILSDAFAAAKALPDDTVAQIVSLKAKAAPARPYVHIK